MKRTIILTFCMVAMTSLTASAQGSKVATDSVKSAVLGTYVKYNVYTPAGYDSRVSKPYPVIYLLHGLYGCNEDWEKRGGMKAIADELINSGEMREAVVIMPNAGHEDIHNVYNGYFNMPDWNYEDFFFTEFIQEVEAKYRCGGSKGLRAVMGLSMGGGGSTVYAQHHPEVFSSCYAMSAWLDCDDFSDEDDADAPHDKFYYTCKTVSENAAIDFVKNASPETIQALRSVKWFFDCGDDDSLMPLSVDLHLAMSAARIKNELRVRDGVHSWEYWHTALRLAFPFASRNFEK